MTEAQREALAKAHDAQREAQRIADIALYTQAAKRLTAEDREWLRATIDMIMAAAPTNVAELVLHIGIDNL